MKRKFYIEDYISQHAINILDIAEDAIICANSKFEIILFNKGAEKIFGYKAKEILYQPLDLLVPIKHRSHHNKEIGNFSNSHQKLRKMGNRLAVSALHKNGYVFPAEVTISKSKINEIVVFTAILRDMTRIKKFEFDLQQTNENLEIEVEKRTKELRKTNESLTREITIRNKVQDQLEVEFKARLEAEKIKGESIRIVEKSSKLASIGVIAAGITHEINQPLNAIKITVDSMLYSEKRNKGSVPVKLIEKLGQISEGVKRISQIILHMRSFWTSNENAESKINIKDIILKSMSLIERQLQSHGIDIEYIFADDLFTKGNPIHLEQIIINLVMNAMHAIESGNKQEKHLKISLSKRKQHSLVEICDNGTGFANGISSDNLFDPFFSTKKGDGMGLGLAIVKHFTEKLEGNVSFFNNQLGGATFSLELPIYNG